MVTRVVLWNPYFLTQFDKFFFFFYFIKPNNPAFSLLFKYFLFIVFIANNPASELGKKPILTKSLQH